MALAFLHFNALSDTTDSSDRSGCPDVAPNVCDPRTMAGVKQSVHWSPHLLVKNSKGVLVWGGNWSVGLMG